MSAGLPEQPFSEHEQRFFLAEILKSSSIAPNDLLRIIQEREIRPRWTAMAMPTGRSVDSCMANFHLMLSYPRPAVPDPGQPYEVMAGPMHSPRQRRRPSVGQGQRGGNGQSFQGVPNAPAPMTYGQQPAPDLPLQARPSAPDPSMHPHLSHFAAINESPSTPGAYQAAQDAQGYGSDKKGKKRGRPSKAETEIRAAQALARGDPWPPPKRAKNPRTSTEVAAASGEGAAAPRTKAARKQKPKQGPGVTSGHVSAPAIQMAGTGLAGGSQSPEGAAPGVDRMQLDIPEVSRSTIPETQASESPPQESLLEGTQKSAAQSPQAARPRGDEEIPQTASAQPETVQSSITLKQDTTPQTEQPKPTISQA